MAKERLRFDSEKLGFVDVTQENVDGSDLGRSPLDGCEDPPAVFAPPQGDGAVPSEPPLLPREAAAGEPPSDVEAYSQTSLSNHRKTEQFRANHHFFLGLINHMHYQHLQVSQQRLEPRPSQEEYRFSPASHEVYKHHLN